LVVKVTFIRVLPKKPPPPLRASLAYVGDTVVTKLL
jgi:hypothetical protein